MELVIITRGASGLERNSPNGCPDSITSVYHFRPEFLNRLDEIILFKPLTKDNISGIINLIVADLNHRLEDKQLSIELSPDAEQFIVDNAYDPIYGARPLKRYIQKYVETLSAKLILADQVQMGDTILIAVENGELVAKKKQHSV